VYPQPGIKSLLRVLDEPPFPLGSALVSDEIAPWKVATTRNRLANVFRRGQEELLAGFDDISLSNLSADSGPEISDHRLQIVRALDALRMVPTVQAVQSPGSNPGSIQTVRDWGQCSGQNVQRVQT